VSFAEANQRLLPQDAVAWNGLLGVGDPVLGPLPREALRRLRQITQRRGETGTADERSDFVEWITKGIASRNIAGLADPSRNNLYPVDFDALIEQHALLGMTRAEVLEGLPALRGMVAEPALARDSARQRGLPIQHAELLGRDRL
jgi:hypothetical protein